MARPIDEKIVVMRLDNSDFTSRAAETTTLLGKLRDSLNKIPGVNLGKTTEELNAINKEAGNSTIGKLGDAVQNVAGRFTALNVVAITALANITNRAVDAGLQLAKSFTVQPIMDGFKEYETKIGSIGTILANTQWAGTNLNDVNKALGELNTYSDQTIYNFGQMTENIGRFTAAGVKLDDSVVAIKGLSNLAAASGSNVEQLNSAMYQMSQALASGKLNLMDWNSMVNAGMGGKKTQDALVATAKAMGKNVDLSDGFRNSIQQGWLTSEVFLETLKKFGNDQSMIEAATKVRTFTSAMDTIKESIGSGWATTWENIFGNFDQATTFWSNLTSSITNWTSATANARNEFVKNLADKGAFQNIFDGIANAIKPLGDIFDSLRAAWDRVFPPASVDQIVKMTASFKAFTEGLVLNGSTIGKLTTIFRGAFTIIDDVIIIVKALGSAFLKLIPEGTGTGILDLLTKLAQLAIAFNQSLKDGNALTKGIEALGNVLGSVGDAVEIVIGGIVKFAKSLKDNLGGTVDWIKQKLAPIGQFLKDTFSNPATGSNLLGAGTLVGIGIVVKKIMTLFEKFGGTFDSFKDMVSGIGESIGGVFDSLGESLQAFTSQVKYNKLLMIAISIGIIAASLKTLEGIKTEDIKKGIGALTTQLGLMMGAMMLIDKFSITGGIKASITLIALASAVDIMASALKKIADLNPNQLQTGLSGLVGIIASLSIAIIAISKWGGKIKVGSIQLLALSTAIYILSDAVDKMSKINSGDLFKSIGALALIFAELAIFLKVVDGTKFNISSAIGLVAVSAAIQLMVNAIKQIDSLDVNSLIKGLGTIAIILGEIAIFSKIVGGGNLIAAGVGMLIVAGAINALVGPITTFSNMSWEELAKGLGAMAIALLAVAGAGLLASGSIGGAVAIMIMAGALTLLMVPIEAFSKMTWEELAKGFVGLAGGLLLLAGAAVLLTPAVPSMLAFGAGLVVMGAGIALVGAGIALFAFGLVTLATLTAASVAAIVAALALLLQGLTSLIPATVNFVVQLGLALVNGLVALVPPLVNGIAYIIIQLLTTITNYLPQFIDLGTKLILQFLDGMGTALPKLIDGAIQFIVKLVNGMADAITQNSPAIVSAVLNLVGSILTIVIEAGVQTINALFGWIPGVKDATSQIGKTAEKYIRDNFGAKQTGQDKGKDFADGLNGKKGDAQSAGKNVGQGGKDGASATDLATVGNLKGSDFVNGLRSKSGDSRSAGINVANSGRDGMGSVSANDKGVNFGQGFANGISSMWNNVYTSAKNLAISAKNAVAKWIDSHSPSKVAFKLGGFFGQGMSLGIDDQVDAVANSSKNMALTAKDSLNKFLDGFQLPVQDNELHFKAVVDYDKLDPSKFGKIDPIAIQPDTSMTNGLVAATKADLNQNGNNVNSGNIDQSVSHVNQYNIDAIKVEAKGYSTRAELKKLAVQIQDELKNLDDRTKISRGEGVAF